MPSPLELYNEHETLKDAGKNEEAIARLTEALEQDDSFDGPFGTGRHVWPHGRT